MKSNFGKYKGFYFFYYATLAAVFPFMPLFFKEHGFDAAQIGLLMAVGPIITILAQPLWGFACDYLQTRKIILRVAVIGAMAAIFVFPFVSSFKAFLLLVAAFTFFPKPDNPDF